MKNLIVLCTAVLCSLTATAQITFEHEEWTKVKTQAKKEGKIIFVDAYTTWCGPCKWMANNVFTDPSVGEFYNKNFINLKLDMEKGEGLSFAEEFEVNAYPTLLFVDGSGNLLHKHLGALPADRFLQVGEEALTPGKRIGSLLKEYDSKKDDKEFLRTYITRLLSAGIDVTDAATHYFSLLDNTELVTEENFQILQMYYPSSKTEVFDKLYKYRAKFSDLAGAEAVNGLMEGILTKDFNAAIYADDTESFHRIQARINAMDVPFKAKMTTYGDMLYNQSQGNTKAYLKHAAVFGKKYNWNDWNMLNNLAWDMYLDESLTTPKDMKVANKLAKRAVQLEANYYTTDTYASTLYKSGNYAEAAVWARKAIALAQKDGDDHTATSELLEKINAALSQ
jgi:thioredoxin-related protein